MREVESRFPFSLLSIQRLRENEVSKKENLSFSCKNGKAFFFSFLVVVTCQGNGESEKKKGKRGKLLFGRGWWGLRGRRKWRLFNVKFSIIYWILLHYNASFSNVRTRTIKMGKNENKRIHFPQSRIKFLLNFRTFTFVHPFFCCCCLVETQKVYRLESHKPSRLFCWLEKFLGKIFFFFFFYLNPTKREKQPQH